MGTTSCLLMSQIHIVSFIYALSMTKKPHIIICVEVIPFDRQLATLRLFYYPIDALNISNFIIHVQLLSFCMIYNLVTYSN